MSVEDAIIIINGIQNKWYKRPTNYYKPNLNFKFQSYKHSAVNEIKSYLSKHKDQNAINVLEEFRNWVDTFACCTKDGETNFMFSIYYDVATDLLDELLRY